MIAYSIKEDKWKPISLPGYAHLRAVFIHRLGGGGDDDGNVYLIPPDGFPSCQWNIHTRELNLIKFEWPSKEEGLSISLPSGGIMTIRGDEAYVLPASKLSRFLLPRDWKKAVNPPVECSKIAIFTI